MSASSSSSNSNDGMVAMKKGHVEDVVYSSHGLFVIKRLIAIIRNYYRDNISINEFLPGELSDVSNLIGFTRSLRNIWFQKIFFDENIQEYMNCMSRCRALTTLFFRACVFSDDLSKESIKVVVNTFSQCLNLQSISFSQCDFVPGLLSEIAKIVPKFCQLKEFEVFDSTLCRDNDYDELVNQLMLCNVHEFSLGISNFTGEKTFNSLATALRGNRTFRELHIAHSLSTSNARQNFVWSLSMNTTLKILYLDHSEINDVEIELLGRILRFNTTLTILSLESNNFTDVGFILFAGHICGNKTLCEMDFDGNLLVTDKSIPAFINWMELSITEIVWDFGPHVGFTDAGIETLHDFVNARHAAQMNQIAKDKILDKINAYRKENGFPDASDTAVTEKPLVVFPKRELIGVVPLTEEEELNCNIMIANIEAVIERQTKKDLKV